MSFLRKRRQVICPLVKRKRYNHAKARYKTSFQFPRKLIFIIRLHQTQAIVFFFFPHSAHTSDWQVQFRIPNFFTQRLEGFFLRGSLVQTYRRCLGRAATVLSISGLEEVLVGSKKRKVKKKEKIEGRHFVNMESKQKNGFCFFFMFARSKSVARLFVCFFCFGKITRGG